tara:strand:+ start:994 stop:3465 length:2472 start_codon:yes stop_codon:yes gene_type:complete
MSSLSGLGSFLDSFSAGRNRLEDERYRRDRLALDRDRLSLDQNRLGIAQQNVDASNRQLGIAEETLAHTKQQDSARAAEQKRARINADTMSYLTGNRFIGKQADGSIGLHQDQLREAIKSGGPGVQQFLNNIARTIHSNADNFDRFNNVEKISEAKYDDAGNILEEAQWIITGVTNDNEKVPFTRGGTSNDADPVERFSTSQLIAHAAAQTDLLIGSIPQLMQQLFGQPASQHQKELAAVMNTVQGAESPGTTETSRALYGQLVKDPALVSQFHGALDLKKEPIPLKNPPSEAMAGLTDALDQAVDKVRRSSPNALNFEQVDKYIDGLPTHRTGPQGASLPVSKSRHPVRRAKNNLIDQDRALVRLVARRKREQIAAEAMEEGSPESRRAKETLRRTIRELNNAESERRAAQRQYHTSAAAFLDSKIAEDKEKLVGDDFADSDIKKRIAAAEAERERLEGFINPVQKLEEEQQASAPSAIGSPEYKQKVAEIQEALVGATPEEIEGYIEQGFLTAGPDEDTPKEVATALRDAGVADLADLNNPQNDLRDGDRLLALYMLAGAAPPGSEERLKFINMAVNAAETGTFSINAERALTSREKAADLGVETIKAEAALINAQANRDRATAELKQIENEVKSGANALTMKKLAPFINAKKTYLLPQTVDGKVVQPSRASAEEYFRTIHSAWDQIESSLAKDEDPNNPGYYIPNSEGDVYLKHMKAGASLGINIFAAAARDASLWPDIFLNDDPREAMTTEDFDLTRVRVVRDGRGNPMNFQALNAQGEQIGEDIPASQIENLSPGMFGLLNRMAINSDGTRGIPKQPE